MNIYVSSVELGINGDDLSVDDVSAILGMKPTNGWNPGELYLGKSFNGKDVIDVERHRPQWGKWSFSTEGCVHTDSIEEHAVCLLNAFEQSRDALERIKSSPEYDVWISIWYVGVDCGFELKSVVASKLASLCHRIMIRCFQTESEEA